MGGLLNPTTRQVRIHHKYDSKNSPLKPPFSARLPLWLQLWDSFVRVTDSEATVHASAAADAAPQFFADAVESLYQAQLRPAAALGTVQPRHWFGSHAP